MMREKIEQFLDKIRRENTENTVAAYQNDLGQFIHFVQHERAAGPPSGWNEIQQDDVINYILDLKQREYAAASIARKVAALKSFFNYLVDRQLIGDNPTSNVESPPVKKSLPHTIERQKIERLLAEPAKESHPKALRDAALLELLYATGMRVSEIVALNMADVDLDQGIVTCISRKRQPRAIRIQGNSLFALDAYLNDGRGTLLPPTARREDALFLNHRGQRLTRQGLWLIVKYYADLIGITEEVTPHTLRHSFAAHKIASGEADLQEVQRTLGHASRSTTQVYANLVRDGAVADDIEADNP